MLLSLSFSACEQCVHRQCVEELGEACSKKKKNRVSAFVTSKPKSQGGLRIFKICRANKSYVVASFKQLKHYRKIVF